MKKLFVFFVLGFILYGCSCFSQIPPQYVYVDSECVGVLPDYSGIVIVTDNCEIADITQIPVPGTQILNTTQVEMRAIDVSGNVSSMYFNAILLDTIPPSIHLNPEWTGYSRQEIDDMYKTFYGFIQEVGVTLNETFPGQPYTVEMWDGVDTLLYTDTLKIYNNMIPIPDTTPDKWWETGGPISYIFEAPAKVFVRNE